MTPLAAGMSPAAATGPLPTAMPTSPAARLPHLQQVLDIALSGFTSWGELVDHLDAGRAGTLIDQAEDLRRLFRQAANGFYELLTELRQAQDVAAAPGVPYPPAILAVVCAAASLDAAAQAISPVASGLRHERQLLGKAQASRRATSRFLIAATYALTQAHTLLGSAQTPQPRTHRV